MQSVRKKNLKSFLLQCLMAALLTGIFTITVYQLHWLFFLVGLLIGSQVYSYIYAYDHFIKSRISQQNFLLSLISSSDDLRIESLGGVQLRGKLKPVHVSAVSITTFTEPK